MESTVIDIPASNPFVRSPALRRSFTATVLLVLIFFVQVSFASAPSAAATISKKSDELCAFSISGEIEKGDFARFLKITDSDNENIDQNWDIKTAICLDSPGGNLSEAIFFADHFYNVGFSTVIPDGAACLSACSIMFMMGTHYFGEVSRIDRMLHVTGRLGFHRPAIALVPGEYSSEAVNSAFDAAVESILKIVELANRTQVNGNIHMMRPELLREMLTHRGDSLFLIDTVGKVGESDISLFGFDTSPAELTREDAYHTCANASLWRMSSQANNLNVPKYGADSVELVANSDVHTQIFKIDIPGEDSPTFNCVIYMSNNGNENSINISFDYSCIDRYFRQSGTSKEQIETCDPEQYSLKEWAYMINPRDTPLFELASPAGSSVRKHDPDLMTSPPTSRFMKNTDLVGADILKAKAGTVDGCEVLCKRTTGCRAFTYDRWNRLCILKSSVHMSRLSPKATSGLLQGAPVPPAASNQFSLLKYPKKTFRDEARRTLRVDGEKTCAASCAADHGCVAYTYFRLEQSCRLFAGEVAEYFPDPNASSGAKTQTSK